MLRLFKGLWVVLFVSPVLAGTLFAAVQSETRLHYGDTVPGHLSANAAEQAWRFSGNAGDWILLDMRASADGDLDTFLTLLDPQGNTLASDDDGGEGTNARIGPLRLAADGDYTILAGRYDGAGAYLLTLHNLALLPALTLDKPLIGALDSEHPADFFALTPTDPARGQLLRLTVRSGDPAGTPILALHGPQGVSISTEDSGRDALDPLPITAEGPYALVVSWNGQTSGGDYELWLTRSEVALLIAGETIAALPGSTYFFQAEAGTTVRLLVTAGPGQAPALTVTALGSDEVLFSNSGGSTRALDIMLDAPVTGFYRVDFGDAVASSPAGAMTLLFEIVPD
ncbi:MAG: hypothetical protein Kow00106_20920 [Anaerolineae bacterium]